MNSIGNLDFLSVGIAIASTIVLGFSVLFNNYKSKTNQAFFYFTILTAVWGFFNLISYRVSNLELALLFIRIEVFLGTWHSFAIFHLLYVFPKDNTINFPNWYKKILLPFVLLISILTLTPFVFSGIASVSSQGTILTLETKPGVVPFGLTVFSLVISSFFILLRKTIRTMKEEKNKFLLLLTGSIITFSLILSLNFVLPAFFNNTSFIPFGAIFILPFVIFTSYAILRHKLFNVRVAGVAALVFSLSIVSFFEVILADNLALIIYRSGILLFIVAFGVLLIKSVLKEVRQREEIAKMAEDVRRAYVIEKKAKEELEKIDKVKDQFVMITQHNLRTPLTSMMGYLDLLLQGAFGKQNKKTIEVVKKFHVLVQGMIKMVNDFLNVAQFQLGKEVLSLKPGVELLPILDEIVSELKFKADSKGVYLKFEKPTENFRIKADREKLKAALFNIVDNAVKYTVKGGVTVKIPNSKFPISNQTPNTQDLTPKVLIEVKDTGIGIPKEKINNIFDQMFERTEEAKKVSTLGIGIGLYLSGQIIKSHQGKVWAKSEGEGKGSVFYVELPQSTNN